MLLPSPQDSDVPASPGEMARAQAQRLAQTRLHLGPDVELVESPDGLLMRGPVLKRRGIHRFFSWMFRLPPRVTVQLDSIGALVARRIAAGDATLASLAEDVALQVKLRQREAESAVTVFVRQLAQRRLLRIEAPAMQAKS